MRKGSCWIDIPPSYACGEGITYFDLVDKMRAQAWIYGRVERFSGWKGGVGFSGEANV